ncbi:flagellar basal-body MS-ring/collar protein FliF [Rhodobacteraceae bacterium XHP0102]|nr:flagellar basal-body MS-ring/collar protein FliF [Rhodobacteraceae bacterium XHP0102]
MLIPRPLGSGQAAEGRSSKEDCAVQNVSLIWMSLDRRKQAMLIGAAAAMIAVFVILARFAAQPPQALLYAGLDAAAAGDVITALEARGAGYSVRGDAIYVDHMIRDELRMGLAAEGLPSNSGTGYELLDQLSAFGTTSQMFDAAYWRAKEGELARTILSSPHLSAARVHIAIPSPNLAGQRTETTASVTVRATGGAIATAQAEALRHLVAASVPGLAARNVAIIDADSGQVIGAEEGTLTAASDRAERLRLNILRLLEARVGTGNAVVEVAVELSTESETLTERRIDPESRVIISSEAEESTNSSRDGGGGAVTVASNLPAGDAANGQGAGSAQSNETRERTTFDLSEIQREVQMYPGALRRITVAVMVNEVQSAAGDVTPRSTEELAALDDLVRSAIGFDEARGDLVTIRSMPFKPVVAAELVEANPGLLARLDITRLGQMALLSVVALAIAFGLLRPLLQSAPLPALDTDAALDGAKPLGIQGREAGTAMLPYEQSARTEGGGTQVIALSGQGTTSPQVINANITNAQGRQNETSTFEMLPTLNANIAPMGMEGDGEMADPIERLRKLIEEREDDTVEILRTWMLEDEVQASGEAK